MKLKFNPDKTVTIDMKAYIEQAIETFGEDVTKGATTPAKKDLFEVNERSQRLSTVKADTYHSVVAKMLYVSLRGRPDAILTVAFLCTRVSCSTEQDWEKLRRLMRFLFRTIDDHLVLGADNM